ncbi:hypothetical protein [Pseudomonas sp. Marseille-QA0892]
MSTELDRAALLAHPEALDCVVFRPDPNDADEERELGDGRILIAGPFEVPADWDVDEREAYFGDGDEVHFFKAHIEPEAEAGQSDHFTVTSGDYLGVTGKDGHITMYYVHDQPAETKALFVLERMDED